VEYSSALRDLNPKLVNQLYKTYQEKLHPQPARRRDQSRGGNEDKHYADGASDDEPFPNQREYFSEREARGRPVRRDSADRGVSGKTDYVDLGRSEGWASARATGHVAASGAVPTKERSTVAWATAAPSPRILAAEESPWHTTVAVGAEHRTAGPQPAPVADPTQQWATTRPFKDLRSDHSGSDTQSSSPGAAAAGPRGQQGWVQAEPTAPSPVIATPAAPLLRKLSARTVAVNAETQKSPQAATSPVIEPQVVPQVTASVEIVHSISGWAMRPPLNAMSRSLQQGASTVTVTQQSLGEASLASTAMSADSLAAPSAHLSRSRYDPVGAYSPASPATPETPATAASVASYENVDLSRYVLRDSPHGEEGRSPQRWRASAASQESRDLYEEDVSSQGEPHDVATPVPATPLEGVEEEDSMMIEEFDDSVHMDHHPVKAPAALTKPLPTIPEDPVRGGAKPIPAAPASPGMPPSASKHTPQRGRTVHSPDYEYSMEGDSPFQDLSAGPSGQKDYNQLLGRRANNSHISSNDSYLNQSGMSPSTGPRMATGHPRSMNSTVDSTSYDMNAFEEDDPFGRSGPSQQLNLTQISSSSGIDQSKSISIDFVLPSESKDLHRRAEGSGSKDYDYGYRAESKSGPLRSAAISASVGTRSSYVEEDLSGEVGLFSPLGGARASSGARGGDDDDDDVLMGTAKISFGGSGPPSFTPGLRPGLLASLLPNTGDFSRDSLGSGPLPNSGGSTPGLAAAGRERARKPSPFSPVHEHGAAQDTSLDEEDESIAPPTYDSLLGPGGTVDDSARTGSLSLHASAQDSFGASFDESQHLHAQAAESDLAEEGRPQWTGGRAGLEAIELATALDVYVTAVRLESHHARIYPQVSSGFGVKTLKSVGSTASLRLRLQIQVRVEFLEVQTEPSEVVTIAKAGAVQAVNFSARTFSILLLSLVCVTHAVILFVYIGLQIWNSPARTKRR
jgi:hypothetical protein